MKTKTFLLICLVAGMGMTRLSAQTKSVPYRWENLNWGLELPVYCDGVAEEVDRVVLDEFTMAGVDHYTNGVKVWTTCRVMGTAHSKFSPYEVFTYKETDQKAIWEGTTYTAIYNLRGDLGHHYVGTLVVEFNDNMLILHPEVIKAKCTLKEAKGK
jgi:hypothetical protein